MGRKGKNTSLEQRKLVIFHYERGKIYKEIAEILNMKTNTVGDIVRRYKNEGRIHFIKQTGKPKKLNRREENSIVRKIKANPRLSAPKLVTEVLNEFQKKVSESTIRRTIRAKGFHGRVARRKPLVNLRNRRARLSFAREYLHKPETWWEDVIFADESKYNVFGSDGRVMVWRRPNEELQPQNLKPTVKHGNGHVMVWGCMGAKGVGKLVFIDGIMNKESYLNILRQNLKDSANKLGVLESFKFYQDNDPKHKSRLIQEWLLYNCPKVLQPHAQSPDMNPIENLCDELDRRIRKHPITSVSDLKLKLQEEWDKIPVSYTASVVKNMPNRLSEVIKQIGYPTKY